MALTIGMINTLYGINTTIATIYSFQNDFLYNTKFIIDDGIASGDYVGTVDLLRGKSDGSETFELSGTDSSEFDINSSTGVITRSAGASLSGPDDLEITITGTLDYHVNDTCTVDIQVYTIQNEYYVRTDGDNGNTGTSNSSAGAWATWTYAVSQVVAGDKVWIQVGDYGAENVVTSTDGTSSLPIVYEGFRVTPGDITEEIGNGTNTYFADYTFGDALDSTEMPLIDGGDRTSGYGMTLSGENYQYWRNIQIMDYHIGIVASTVTELWVENVIAHQFGSSADSNGMGTNIKWNTNSLMRNCHWGNGSSTNVLFESDGAFIDKVHTYCNEDSAATDYYLSLQGDNGFIYNSTVTRIGELSHFGHGINLNGSDMDTNFNLIKNCETFNTGEGFVVRKPNVTNNIFEDCIVNEGSDDLDGGGAAITIRNGASYNIFRRFTVVDAWHGIGMSNKNIETTELHCGRYNRVENSVFIDTQHCVLNYNWYDNSRIADYLEIVNCTMDNTNFPSGGLSDGFLINSDRPNLHNVFINCIITGFDDYYDQVEYPGTYDNNSEFENCNFYGNNFSTPSGTSITEYDPEYVSGTDYHLQSTSDCINIGQTIDKYGINLLDFDGDGIPLGQFKADTENAVDNGTSQISHDATTDNGALECVYVDDSTGFTITLDSSTGDLASNLSIGTEYCLKINAEVDTGDSVDLVVWDGDSSTSQTVTSDELEDYTFDITIATGTTPYFTLANLDSGDTIRISRYNVREITGTIPDVDMDMNPIVSTPDLGAYEYQG